MSTLGTGYVTLNDVRSRTDPNGSPAIIAEVLAQSNMAVNDMPWSEGNSKDGMRGTVRTGIPAGTWRKLYGGVPKQKTTTAQVTDTCGMLENRSEPDKDLVEMYTDQAQFRMDEASGIMEGMAQTFASTLFYGNTDVNPERFMGLSPRYNTLTGAPISDNIIGAGGTTNLTSAWVIKWHPQWFTGIYPQNSIAGLEHEPLGLQDAFDSNGDRYRAYIDRFQWKCGLHVKDWRYACRIANIDTVALAALTGTQAVSTYAATELIITLAKALERIPEGPGQTYIYCNRRVKEYLNIHALQKTTNVLSIGPGLKQFETSFLGVPIHRVDQLLNSETAVA